MLSNDRKRIILMDPVRINWKLSKHCKRKVIVDGEELTAEDDNVGSWINIAFESDMSINGNSSSNRSTLPLNVNVWDGIPFAFNIVYKNEIHKSIAKAYIKLRLFLHKTLEGSKLIKPEQFFDEVKGSFKELESFDENELKVFNKEINKLENNYQKHLTSKLSNELKSKVINNKLIEAGFNKYQEESDIINFIMKTGLGLCLEEVQYFKYDIPDDVSLKMKVADDLKLFDNFYILYKDPNVKQPKLNLETKKEKKKRVTEDDPIMFGVVAGSTKMHYIGDWVSDFCDLTYETLINAGSPDRKLKNE